MVPVGQSRRSDWDHTMSRTEKARVMSAATPAVQDICDSYVYLLGRLLVLRQEHLEFMHKPFAWNTVVHSEAGGPTWTDHLDIAYSEAWIAVDDHTCTLIEVPDLRGRYYTIQLVNPWGETIANINERTYPHHPSGAFLISSKRTRVTLPRDTDTLRIDLPGRKARMLLHLEHGVDRAEALALQRQIRVRATGRPVIAAPVAIPMFTNDALPGVEAFDIAPEVLESEPDSNPDTDILQAKVHTVARAAAAGLAERERIDHVIHDQVWTALGKEMGAMDMFRNGWVRPRFAGSYDGDWIMRTVGNLRNAWTNTHEEVVSFRNGTVLPLSGDDTYMLRFSESDLPSSHVKYFWSVSCADTADGPVNALERRPLLNQRSNLQYDDDGSLTLYFAPQRPQDAPDENWLQTPAGRQYVLTWRAYGPDRVTVSGHWFPPRLEKMRPALLRRVR